jgi:hypothetical protein
VRGKTGEQGGSTSEENLDNVVSVPHKYGADSTHLVNLRNDQTSLGNDSLGLLGDLSVDGSRETIESHSVDGTRKIHTILQRLNGTGSGTAAGTQTSLGVLNSQSKLGLGSLVSLRAGFGARDRQSDLGLLGEFLGKVLAQQIVECLSAQVELSTLRELDVFTLSGLADSDVQARLSQIDNDNGLVSVLSLSRMALLRLAEQSSLLPLLSETNSVSNQDGGGLVQKLQNGDSSSGGGRLECVSLRSGEPGRARDDGSGGFDTEEIGSALEEG